MFFFFRILFLIETSKDLYLFEFLYLFEYLFCHFDQFNAALLNKHVNFLNSSNYFPN